jgi:hypothetical protein
MLLRHIGYGQEILGNAIRLKKRTNEINIIKKKYRVQIRHYLKIFIKLNTALMNKSIFSA